MSVCAMLAKASISTHSKASSEFETRVLSVSKYLFGVPLDLCEYKKQKHAHVEVT